jgi:hypothetical protein
VHRSFLMGVANQQPSLQGLAEAGLDGDELAVSILDDALELEGVEMASDLLKAGEKVCVQTVTYAYLGRVKEVTHSEVILEEASCVYDTGRFGEFLTRGTISVLEPFADPISVGRTVVVCCTPWRHPLPRKAIPE